MATTNLPYIQQQMIRYGMSIYFGLGLAGNICNCIMFTRPSYRRTPSSIYHLSDSILALFHLIWSISPQLYTLNYPDLQKQSILYCKMRLYGSHVLALCVRYIILCACLDRFFATRDDVRLRSLSSFKMATILVFGTCIVCTLIGIHIPILMEIRGTTCGMFGIYKLIYALYQILSVSILPPALMIVFSALTLCSLHQRHATQERAKRRDRYLLRMIIAEVSVTIFTSIPHSTNLIYGAATYYDVNKSAQRVELESFLTFLTQFLIYLLSVIPFYLFICVSEPFRNEFINLMVKCLNNCMPRQNQIMPMNTHTNTATVNGSITLVQPTKRQFN
ncbi:unnamed protein product [Rotaria sp. Silwood1]|nr:unnamed protein product [Rotaria sp. Silwood1]CAF1560997.1 unnamed protein product [Rotaria sp. Silwood1]CAF3622409.1 unnamed protein product [Rotaria sp. Silwood1]CAF3752100.1 unnamed protein product [Rotaria sp. Silwood1]CAF4722765.1 unnamed protein product [Rotaria sp. Silwood1]